MAWGKEITDRQKAKEKILDILYLIRDELDWPVMEEVFHIKGIKNSGYNTQELKALLIKLVCDTFKAPTIISDYFLAVFGLQLGYGSTNNVTARRKKLLHEMKAAMQKGLGGSMTIDVDKKDAPYNYAKNVIHEADRMEELSVYIVEIEDLVEYSRDLYEYIKDIGGMLVAAPPMPSYKISVQITEERNEQPNYITARIATELMHQFILSGEALELSIVSFDEEAFLSALDRVKNKGLIKGREYYGWKNVMSVFKYGTDILEAERAEIDTTKGFDFDWLVRFFDAVETVSNEDMQKLWGKILAGEIKHQGAFSFRTIETLRNLSANELYDLLKVFNLSVTQVSFYDQKISAHVDIFPFYLSDPTIEVQGKKGEGESDGQDGEVLERIIVDKFQIERKACDLNDLQDRDLLDYNEKEMNICLNISDLGFIIGDIILVIKCIAPIGTLYTFKYKAFNFRRTVKELYSVANVTPDIKYMITVAKSWRSWLEYNNDDRFIVSVHKVRSLDLNDRTIELGDEDLLETEFRQ